MTDHFALLYYYVSTKRRRSHHDRIDHTMSRIGLGVLLVMVVAVWALVVSQRSRKRAKVPTEWVRAHRLAETPETLALASSYLQRRRTLRNRCVLVAIVVPLAIELAVRGSFTISLLPIMGAYAVGTLWAELTLTRPRGEVTRASLTTRQVSRYLSPTWLWIQRIAAVVAFASLAAPTQMTQRAPGDVQLPSDSSSWLWAAAAVGITVVAEIAEWWIVRRPQPAATPELIAADDAIRSTSVHAIAGVVVAVLVIWASTTIMYATDGSGVLVVAGFGLAMVLWRWCARTIRPMGPEPVSGVIGITPAL